MDGSTKSSGNDNLFHSSRNGSNASGSSSSGNRYKRNLVQRPHSPTALITSHPNTSSWKKTSTSTSESTSPDNSIINEDNWKNDSNNVGTSSKRKQLYNKKNSDSRLHSNAFTNAENGLSSKYENGVWQAENTPQYNNAFSKKSLVFNNHNNAKNTIYNIDLTDEGLQRLKIEEYSKGRRNDAMLQESSIIPPLTRINNSYKNLISSNSSPENHDSFLSIGVNNVPSKISAVRLNHGQCQRPSELDVLSNEKRKPNGYIFHTFGYKTDATN